MPPAGVLGEAGAGGLGRLGMPQTEGGSAEKPGTAAWACRSTEERLVDPRIGGRPEGCSATTRAPAPFTCHEYHEHRAAPLGRRDGGRNGALEPQHRSPRAQALARSVVAAVPKLAPPSPSSGPAAPAAPAGLPPASAQARNPVSSPLGRAQAREPGAPCVP